MLSALEWIVGQVSGSNGFGGGIEIKLNLKNCWLVFWFEEKSNVLFNWWRAIGPVQTNTSLLQMFSITPSSFQVKSRRRRRFFLFFAPPPPFTLGLKERKGPRYQWAGTWGTDSRSWQWSPFQCRARIWRTKEKKRKHEMSEREGMKEWMEKILFLEMLALKWDVEWRTGWGPLAYPLALPIMCLRLSHSWPVGYKPRSSTGLLSPLVNRSTCPSGLAVCVREYVVLVWQMATCEWWVMCEREWWVNGHMHMWERERDRCMG